MADEKPLPRIVVYERQNAKGEPSGTFDWRLLAKNGQTIATSGGQGYESVKDAQAMATRIIKSGEFKDAPIYIPSAPKKP